MVQVTTQPQQSTTRIFDRSAAAAHPWSDALKDLEKSNDSGRMALCGNLRMDHRVESMREQGMLNTPFLGGRPTGETFLTQWREYYQSALCRPAAAITEDRLPAYLRPSNENNRVTAKIPEFEQLIHVTSLNRLLWRLSQAECGASSAVGMNFSIITQCEFPVRERSGECNDRTIFNKGVDTLAEGLLTQGKDVIKKMAGFLCEALGPNQPPWWACFAEDVNAFVRAKDWASLCKALGLGYLTDNEWILMWRYEAGVAMPLFRPTQVEANDTPYHYPSPPSSQYGITMPLDARLPNCREVVHPPLSTTDAEEACTGEIGKIRGFAAEARYHLTHIPRFRRAHGKRLEREFADVKDAAWFERHKGLL